MFGDCYSQIRSNDEEYVTSFVGNACTVVLGVIPCFCWVVKVHMQKTGDPIFWFCRLLLPVLLRCWTWNGETCGVGVEEIEHSCMAAKSIFS